MSCWTLCLFWHLAALPITVITSSQICSVQGMINPFLIRYAGLFVAHVISRYNNYFSYLKMSWRISTSWNFEISDSVKVLFKVDTFFVSCLFIFQW